MKYTQQPFSKVLEEYVFRVANQFIESVDQTTQSELINLINGLDQVSVLEPYRVNPACLQIDHSAESEWQPILDKPVNWRSVHNQWLSNLLRQYINRHEYNIARLEQAVQTTEQRFLRIQDGFLSESRRASVLKWYKQVLTHYQQQLVRTQMAHQSALKQLNQLQRQFSKRV